MMKHQSVKSLLAAGLLLAGSTHVLAGNTDTSRQRGLSANGQPLPEYPRQARDEGLEGYAIVEFSVLPDGSVSDAEVRESSSRLFGRAALDSVRHWNYPAASEPTDPVKRTVRFSFAGQ